MTLQTTGTLAVSDINTEIGLSSTYSDDLAFLNNKIVAAQRPTTPNFGAFYGLTHFQNSTQGNCDNANAAGVNCNCGNVNCSATANCAGINCTNCDTQPWLQTNCNCACTYNCTNNQNCFSYNCNCSKIICTKLYEIGMLPKDVFEADQAFGDLLKVKHPDVYNGYIAWAQIVVDWMSGKGPKMMPWMSDEEFSKAAQNWSTSWAETIATPWADYMAYKMGLKETINKTGFVLMMVGIPISKVVGVWQRIFGKSTKPTGFGKGLMLIGIFVLLKAIVEIGKLFGQRTESLAGRNA
jgi:hypothetical protein